MRYTVSIDIAVPLTSVVALLTEPAHRPAWLRGLVLHEPLSGPDGQVGTTSRVVMELGGQRAEMIETITRREPADLTEIPPGTVVHFDREIVGEGMWSAARERLTANGDSTRWESENEYRFTGVIMRLVALVMPATFRKQSLLHMRDFTAFAEHGTDVREP